MNKRGMETWILVFWIIALVMLVLVLMWYGGLGKQLGNMLESFLKVF